MKAFLLAAGVGSRLRPITDATPKCMLKIGGRPLLLLAVLLIFLGFQFLTIGLLGEMLARTYHESQDRPVYVVGEVLQDGGTS